MIPRKIPKSYNFNLLDALNIKLNLRDRVTVINGNSATGKSYLYTVINQYKDIYKDNNIYCFNKDIIKKINNKSIIDELCKLKDGLIVIDQADKLLEESNKELYEFIRHDKENHYILMGRACYWMYSQLAYLDIDKESIKLQYYNS